MSVSRSKLSTYLPFFIKTETLFAMSIVLLFVFAVLIGSLGALSTPIPATLKLKNLNKEYDKLADQLDTRSPKEKKRDKKGVKKDSLTNRVYLLTFTGDVAASELKRLRKEISVIVQSDVPVQEVIVKLKSGGGFVHSYGLAAAQLQRIRDAGILLTVVVDEVAASGGYMMACVADTLIGAPFSILGSIGVVAEFPNFSELMKKNGISYEQHTAGEYKRTVSPFVPTTEKTKKKMADDLALIHKQFKDLIIRYRPEMDMKKVATGEYWYGSEALARKLVDRIQTSDELIQERMKSATVYKITFTAETSLSEQLAHAVSVFSENILLKLSKSYINNSF